MSAEDDADFLKRFSVALERKGGTNAPCPVCGHMHWVVDPRQTVLLKASSHDLDDPQLAHEPAIASVCGNCGLARFHIRSVLLDEHEKPSTGPTPHEQHSSAGP